MSLHFKNGTQNTIFVAYGYHSPSCEGGTDWAKKGWFRITPGGTAKVFSGVAGGRKYFFFAENEAGTSSWSGPYFTQLPSRAFDWCWETGSSESRMLGLSKLEVGWGILDHTVRFI